MPEPRKPIPADPTRIDISNRKELYFWCRQLNCNVWQLLAAVKVVGPGLNDVKHALGIR